MFTTCLFCHSRLGRNEVVEHFPVGARVAFDAAKGRLWAICTECHRWNLAPLESRWEAIEECERLFRATRARVSTDNIGLAPLRGGVDLVRIGTPLRPEFAAWRYGSQLRWRRRRAAAVAGLGAAAAVVAAPAVAAAVLPVLAPAVVWFGATGPMWIPPWLIALDLKDRFQWERVALRLKSPRGRVLTVRMKHLWASSFYAESDDPTPALRLAHDGGAMHYRGADALANGSKLLARANWLGGAGSIVQKAVSRIEATGDAEGFLASTAAKFARFRGKRIMAEYRRIGALNLALVERLALEMAVHEESERQVLEGALQRLEADWREAEEVAAIADALFEEPSLDRRTAQPRPRVTLDATGNSRT